MMDTTAAQRGRHSMTDDLTSTLDAERPALRGLAYRMLGSLSDAEDAVQDAFVRWVRLSDAQRSGIENPGAWMMRVTSRICLDMLGSARARRETYVGPWLPEPVPALTEASRATDPLERVTLDDSVSMALQVVLDTPHPPAARCVPAPMTPRRANGMTRSRPPSPPRPVWATSTRWSRSSIRM